MTRNAIYVIILSAALVAGIVLLWLHHARVQEIDPDTPAGPAGVVRNGNVPNVRPMKPDSDLVSEIAILTSNDKYSPPADGRLTDAQMVMYLKVREHEKVIAEVAMMQAKERPDSAKKAGEKSFAGMMEGFKTMGSSGDQLISDIRSAKDLGYNTQEYLWVKSQVIAASSATLTSKMTEATNASFDAAYAQMRSEYGAARDDQTRKMYKTILDGYDKQRATMKTETPNISPAVAYNQHFITRYGDSLNAITNEIAKYEDRAAAMRSITADQKTDETVEMETRPTEATPHDAPSRPPCP